MLTPLDRLEIDALLHQFPKRTQLPQKSDPLFDRLEHVVNLPFGRETADAEADAAVRALIAVSQRPEHVARLERGGGTGGAGGEGDVLEGHEEGFPLDVGEGNVDTAGVVAVGVAV
jgi:hypothetical protein